MLVLRLCTDLVSVLLQVLLHHAELKFFKEAKYCF